MNGALVIDKPEGMTSHDVVVRVRRLLKTKRVGHTGTLDPFATGVLVTLVGQATRLAQFLDKDEKEYEALVKFGYETDTGDRTGTPNSKFQIPDSRSRTSSSVSLTEIESVFDEFRGEIEQVPPMFSAKKVGGKKLYELARQGQEIAREPSRVFIKKLEILDSDQFRNSRSEIRIRVVCSAGTYIRTLGEDIGRRLGVGAHLQELRRMRAGRFDISRAVTLEDLEASSDPSAMLVTMEELVAHLPKFIVASDRLERTRSGLSTRTDLELVENQPLRMLDESNRLVAIGFFDAAEKSIRPKIVLV
jgi:tRNA pseudouridine55 synthase